MKLLLKDVLLIGGKCFGGYIFKVELSQNMHTAKQRYLLVYLKKVYIAFTDWRDDLQ